MKDSLSANLKKRWVTNKINLESAISGNLFKDTPFGLYRDHADFRGFSSKDVFPSSDVLCEIKDAYVKRANFSKSRFSTVHFSACRFEGCLFDDSIFESDVRFWSQCEFTDCRFLNSTFINCAFNSVIFSRCSFERTKWKSKNVFSVCSFRDCLFFSNIKNFSFSDTSFINSKFRGVLENVTFLGWSDVPDEYFINGEWSTVPDDLLPNRMDGVDFSEAELKMCNFSQYCRLDKIIPPLTTMNCAFYITDIFCNILESIIEMKWKKNNSEYYRIGIDLLNTFYCPDNRTPAAIAHNSDHSKYFGEDFSTQFYSALCLAATQANAVIMPSELVAKS